MNRRHFVYPSISWWTFELFLHFGSCVRSPGEGKGCPLRYSGLENSSPWGYKESDTTELLSLSLSKSLEDGDCSHEIKRHLLLGRKAMTNLDSVLKNRDIILPTKIRIVKAMIFPVVMCRGELDHKEGWALKNWWFQIVGEDSWESFGLQGDQTSQS